MHTCDINDSYIMIRSRNARLFIIIFKFFNIFLSIHKFIFSDLLNDFLNLFHQLFSLFR